MSAPTGPGFSEPMHSKERYPRAFGFLETAVRLFLKGDLAGDLGEYLADAQHMVDTGYRLGYPKADA